MAATPQVMDCIDCHNRPSHDYQTPQDFVDFLIATGDISKSLPEIKKIAMEVFNNTFDHPDTAIQVIDDQISEFYLTNYPELVHSQKVTLDKAIKAIQGGFLKNIFPVMKASWDAYPNHIGHTEYNGCFRCHNNIHTSKTGKVISKECDNCHTILIQGNTDSLQVAPFNESLEFIHPVDIDDAWKEYNCTECHRYLYI